MEYIVEICCGSYADCLQAAAGGAKRVELNSALFMGGLTPSLAALQLTKQHTDVKVIAMVRPRGAGFCYNEQDFATMLLDTSLLLEYGADGIAFGCLNENGEIQVEQTAKMMKLIKEHDKEAVFHRAFDCCKKPFTAIETLISLGVDRVLTSGGKAKAVQGIELLSALQTKYGSKIEILAGSGMNAGNAKQLLKDTGIHQIHSSCKAWRNDPTTMGEDVSYAYAESDHETAYDVVDADLVRQLIESIQ